MRVKICGSKIRDLFFESLKNSLDISWKELRYKFSIPKSTFDHYRSGRSLLPENLFNQFADLISESEKVNLFSNIEKFPDNFGQVIGGKSAYKINFEKFKEGREIGARSLIHKSKQDIVFSLDLTTNICEVIGAFIGDGCFNLYNNKVYHIEFAGDVRYDLPYYQNIIVPAIQKIIPNISPHFYKGSGKENAQRIVFYSKNFFLFLKNFVGFTPGNKTFTVKIPSIVYAAGDECLRATIRGIFDTDGGVFLDKRSQYKSPYPRIVFQTVSRPLYDQLFTYLSDKFKLYNSFNSKRQVYIIEIYGINQVKRWMNLIGFSNKRHLDRLASVAQW